MKIVLIEPRAPGLHIFSMAKLPRLGLLILGTIAKKSGHEVIIFCEELAEIDWKEIMTADLVCLTSLTSTATRTQELIKKIKELKSDLPIVVGGPHYTFRPLEALEAGASFVVRREGEITFPKLVDWLERKGDVSELRAINGLTYKLFDRIYETPDNDLIDDLDSLPFPDFSLLVGYQKMSSIAFQISRGCPYNCNFCLVIKMFGRKIRIRHEVMRIVDELENLLKKSEYKFLFVTRRKNIFFYDDNFYANPELIKEILREIIRRGLKLKFSAQIRIDAARDEEFLQLFRQAGGDYCYIGYESVNPETLKSYSKNIKIQDMINWTKIFRKHGIRIHGMFVLGGDFDTWEDLKQTVRFAIKIKLDTVQFLILTPVPGTEQYDQLLAEGRIISHRWSDYDGHHVVYKPKKLTERELFIGTLLKAMPNFYSLWRAIPKILNMIFHVPFASKLTFREKFENFALRLYGHHLLKKLQKNLKRSN